MVQLIDSVLDDILKHSIRGKTNRTNALTSSKTIDKAAQRNTRSSPSLGDMYLTSQGYTQAIVKISSYCQQRSKSDPPQRFESDPLPLLP